MVEAIRKLALGFQLVYMGMLVIVLGFVVLLICEIVLPFAVQAGYIPIETMMRLVGILPIAMAACMLIGCIMGIAGRYICTQTPEIAGKARADIRTSFTLEMSAFVPIMVISIWKYLIPAIVILGILPESLDFVGSMKSIISIIGFILVISSVLYFVMYMRDLAAFVGADELSERSEMLRSSILWLLQLVFVTIIITFFILPFCLFILIPFGLVIGLPSICGLGLLYVAIFVLSISVFFRYVRIVVAMPAVLNAYDGPSDAQGGPSE